jgi:hypothetical protein
VDTSRVNWQRAREPCVNQEGKNWQWIRRSPRRQLGTPDSSHAISREVWPHSIARNKRLDCRASVYIQLNMADAESCQLVEGCDVFAVLLPCVV